jgi:Resolvase, N terminal domain
MMASVLATFAQFERRLIGQRTKDALAVKRAQGVVLGRPRGTRETSPEALERVRELHGAGLSLRAIARQLNAEEVPTARGGRGVLGPSPHCSRPDGLPFPLTKRGGFGSAGAQSEASTD